MKRNIINIVAAFFLLFLWNACTEENEMGVGRSVEEGIPVSLDLSYGIGNPDKIETKSVLSDGHAFDIYLLIFDGKGKRVKPDDSKSYFTFAGATSGKVTIRTTTGSRYIYAVANVGNAIVSGLYEKLDAISTRDELLSLPISLDSKIIQFSSDRYPLSGFFTEGKSSTEEPTEASLIQIDEENGLGVIKNQNGMPLEGSIKLLRLFSTINFTFTIDGDRVRSFVPTTWDVIHIPSASNLYKKTEEPTDNDYFKIEKMNKYVNANSFEFIMLENLKLGTQTTDANNRENPKIAPANSAYVALRGHYVGSGKKYNDENTVVNNDANVEADVTYYIHLGKGAGSNADKNDYRSERNKTYTYNLKIVGIDQIITEVVVDDPYHRADGDVTYLEGKTDDLDAHYATKVYTFKKAEIESGRTEFQVKTPFSEGRFLKFSTAADAAMPDCWDWVHFMVNVKSQETYSTSPQRYPQNASTNTHLMSIAEFKEYLKNPTYDTKDELVVTCFIDEYYYPNKHWSKFVNKDPRILQIFCQTRAGNGSSFTEAKFIISQKSIYTFYDLSEKISTAWGIEWLNETGQIANGNYGTNAGTSWADGRTNMIKEVGSNKAWYADASSSFSAEFQKAYAACMSRNRDENGDGIIDTDEIKWYLPAINQYMDIWMGTDALPYGFPLYQGTGTKDHFVSNTGKRILWAEEGSSFGNLGAGGDTGTKNIRCVRNLGMNDGVNNPTVDAPSSYYTYKDRVFTFDKMNRTALRPQFLATGELEAHKHTNVSGSNLPYTSFKVASADVKGIIEYQEVKTKEYPTGGYKVSEWGDGYFEDGKTPSGTGWIRSTEYKITANQVYYYRWYKDVTTTKEVYLGNYIPISKLKELLKKDQSPCKGYTEGNITGWRIPNQRELQMMVIKSGLTHYTVANTQYTYADGPYYGYDGNMRLYGHDSQVVCVRCVKDMR